MNNILIRVHDCSREEHEEVKRYLDENCWDFIEVEKSTEKQTFTPHQQKQIKECLECCEGAELERTLRTITGVE